jgi:hypothetical protein
MMCVTVLQSQPSVSIPTLTMQRTSRPGGVQGAIQLLRQLRESVRVHRTALLVESPVCFPYRVQRESHPAGPVAFRFARLGFMDHPRVDAKSLVSKRPTEAAPGYFWEGRATSL